MIATEQLKQDHRDIIRFLAVLENTGRQIQRRKTFNSEFYFRTVDFMRNFIDHCHHAKEEQYLFPAMESHGIAEQGLIHNLLDEHDLGRRYASNLEETVQRIDHGDVAALGFFPEIANNYVILFRSHTLKENNILFGMADRILSNREQEKLQDQFEEVEIRQLGPGRHEEYLKMLEGWEHDIGLVRQYVR
jgi:hemerythrin-like domain-containing protein